MEVTFHSRFACASGVSNLILHPAANPNLVARFPAYRRQLGDRFGQAPGSDSSIANLANFNKAAFVRKGKRPATASFAIPWTSDHAYNARSSVFPAGSWPS